MNATIAILLGITALAAQETPPRVGVGVVQKKLGLGEAIELALASNLEIEIERSNSATAHAAVQAAHGAFDPTFRWSPSVESRTTPTGSVLQAPDGRLLDRSLAQNFYLNQRLPWAGATVRLEFENGRLFTSNPFLSLNPFVSSRLVFGFTQPLLRGRSIDQERTEIHVRRKQADVSDVEFELRVIDVVTRVEQSYWDLVAAREDAQVKSDAVEWAREQLARSRRMIEGGTLAPVELSAAEAELERRLDTWYASLGTITEVENSVKTLLAGNRDAELWNDEILPVDERTVAQPEADDLRAAVAQALKQRPELRVVGLRRETNEIEKRQANEQVKPQVNLVAAYINSGVGGAVRTGDNPFTASNAALYDQVNVLSSRAGLPALVAPSFGGLPQNLIGGYGTAVSNLFGGSFPSYQVGLALDLNLRNRTAAANLSQVVIAERQLKMQQARIEQEIQAQVRNALQAIQTARQRITAAESSARAAKEKLDSEVRLFQTGESTNFLVLTRQNEYSDSRRRAVVAKLDFNKAVARLEQALGTTLREHSVTLR